MYACTVTRCRTEASSFVKIVVVVYMYITLFTDILTLECMLGHQSLDVCEVSDPYPLYTWRNTYFNYLQVFVVVYKLKC